MAKHSEHEHPGYGVFIVTWLSLLVLTAATVTVSGMDLRGLSVMVAIIIASVKSSLVLYFFMHLKYERTLFKTMFFVCIGTLTIFILLTFADIGFR